MLISSIVGNTFHFVVYILGSFIFFATGWLHLDSYTLDKQKKSFLVRGLGFIFLSITNLYFATQLTNPTLNLIFKSGTVFSLLLILLSLMAEKILGKPNLKHYGLLPPISLPLFTKSMIEPQIVLLSLVIAITYLIKSIKGLEKQIKPLFWGFLLYSIANLISIFLDPLGIDNVFWLKLLAPFEIVWYFRLVFYFIAVVIIGSWSWSYIRFRAGVQIFNSIIAATLLIFLVTASLFNYILIQNIEKNTYANLESSVKLTKYLLENLQLETLTIAESISRDFEVQKDLVNENRDELYQKVAEQLSAKRLTSLIMLNSLGQVVIRVEDIDNYGDSLTNEKVVASALEGQKLSKIQKDEGVTYPELDITSAVPIYDEGKQLIGVVVTGFNIDNVFVDGVKEVTGLDINVFADNIRSATTLLSADGKSRLLGTQEGNEKILFTVIDQKKIYLGKNTVTNAPYFSAYLPIISLENQVIGMLSTSKPQLELVSTIQDNIKLTFIGSVLLIIFSVIPSYFLSKYIEKNLSA